MKNILITGVNSYIGTSFQKWCSWYTGQYSFNCLDMRDSLWKDVFFGDYDSVFHVAGLAHISTNPKMEALYYRVNRDLPIETAKKAKADGVKQFVFMSSIIVYGDSNFIDKKRLITYNTEPYPTNFYGKSKLQAEEGLFALQDNDFKVAVLRAPMIYGKDSKGNFSNLEKIARKLPIFPDVDNERSMLHIDNLCEFIRLIIENEESGVFYPQNKEYVKTSDIVKLLAGVYGRRVRLTKFFNPLLRLLGKKIGIVNKAFGNLVYEKSMSEYKENYRIRNFAESIVMMKKS